MYRMKLKSGGFVFIEFAIALPLLILLMYGLATVSIKIFQLGKVQLADYTLETEANYVLEQITHEARAAKSITIEKINAAGTLEKITIIYHTVDENDGVPFINDTWATRIYIPRAKKGTDIFNIYAKRKDDGIYTSPITRANYFGETTISQLKFSRDGKILHIVLEMESINTGKKIKLCTAVFMPDCE